MGYVAGVFNCAKGWWVEKDLSRKYEMGDVNYIMRGNKKLKGFCGLLRGKKGN